MQEILTLVNVSSDEGEFTEDMVKKYASELSRGLSFDEMAGVLIRGDSEDLRIVRAAILGIDGSEDSTLSDYPDEIDDETIMKFTKALTFRSDLPEPNIDSIVELAAIFRDTLSDDRLIVPCKVTCDELAESVKALAKGLDKGDPRDEVYAGILNQLADLSKKADDDEASREESTLETGFQDGD